MKDFLQKLLENLTNLTMTAQEFHCNVKWDLYFCLHKSFNDDYDYFFEAQDIVWELIVKKEWVPNLWFTHSTINTEDHLDMVETYLKLLKETKDMILSWMEKADFVDQWVITPIVEYVDKKIMMYNSFLKI